MVTEGTPAGNTTTCTSCANEFDRRLASCPQCGTAAPVDLGESTVPAAASGAGPAVAGPTSEERNLAMLAHLSAASGLLGFPVVGPLVVWLIYKDKGGFVEENAREALNFNLSFFIWSIVASLTLLLIIGVVLLPLVILTWVVLAIIGAVKASQGETYRYPLTLRLIN